MCKPTIVSNKQRVTWIGTWFFKLLRAVQSCPVTITPSHVMSSWLHRQPTTVLPAGHVATEAESSAVLLGIPTLTKRPVESVFGVVNDLECQRVRVVILNVSRSAPTDPLLRFSKIQEFENAILLYFSTLFIVLIDVLRRTKDDFSDATSWWETFKLHDCCRTSR